MSRERHRDSWPGQTYNGFSGPAPAEPEPPPRRLTKGWLLGGIAAAVVGGGLFGLLARPQLAEAPSHSPQRAAAAANPILPVKVAPVAPPRPTVSAGPLEVLPEDMALAAARNRPVAAPPPAPDPLREDAPAAEDDAAPASTPAPELQLVPAPEAGPQPELQPQRADAGPVCQGTMVQQMVCGDPRLARLDQRLHQAYERALAAGVPYRMLRDEQDDWLGIREDAARHSPEAVASIYRQRIRELNELAAEPGGF
jgi:hypothetical protein